MRKKQMIVDVILATLLIVFVWQYAYLSRANYVYDGDRALYMDDLAAYRKFNNPNTTFQEKLMDTSANKFRPVTNMILMIAWNYIGTEFERIDTVMLYANYLMIACIWLCFYSVQNNDSQIRRMCISTGGSLACICSRLAFYNFEEMFGLMENLALILSLVFLVLLIHDRFRFSKLYVAAHIVMVCSVYTHERYIVLAGVLVAYNFLYIFSIKRKAQPQQSIPLGAIVLRLLVPVVALCLIMAQRLALFGTRALDGTGGTSISETFEIRQFFQMMIKYFGYLVGINPAGDMYLNGTDPRSVPAVIYLLTALVAVAFIFLLILFIKKCEKSDLWVVVLIAAQIVLLAIPASATIRVETRWVYPSYILVVLAAVYMLSEVAKSSEKTEKKLLLTISLAAVFSLTVAENWYAANWKYIYQWGLRQCAASLSDQFDRMGNVETLYIIPETFIPGYLEERLIMDLAEAEGHSIGQVVMDEDIRILHLNGNDRALLWNNDKLCFSDLSDQLSAIQFISGHYEDAWTEPYMMCKVYAEKKSSLKITFYLPDYEQIGGSTIALRVNGNNVDSFTVLPNSIFTVESGELEPGYNVVELISDFFIVENSGRSEDGRLSFVLSDLTVIEEKGDTE